MKRINILSSITASRIAAGEVIERYSSIVKELLENSIDANSKNILIYIKGEYPDIKIIISDDGDGIYEEDIELAFSRYATSKIIDNLSLNEINTLGFRGEALPSISSIAEVKLVSRDSNSDSGWIVAAGPDYLKERFPISHPYGTKVEVSSIFNNHPVKLKFLKSKRIELNCIQEEIINVALSHPNISFKYYIENNLVLNFQSTNDIQKRICDIFGDSFKKDSFYFENKTEGLQIFGLSSVPTKTKKDSSECYLIVNGRRIYDKTILSSIRSAYLGLIETGCFPFICLYLTIDSKFVDINIHPRKMEVRFLDSIFVSNFITNTLKDFLYKLGARTSTDLSSLAIKLGEKSSNIFLDNSSVFGIPIGQVNDSWIISKLKDGICIIDQHAAHERVLLEKLKNFNSDQIFVVDIKNEIFVFLKNSSVSLIEQNNTLFENIGFKFNYYDDKIGIIQYPSIIGSVDFNIFLNDIVSYLYENRNIDIVFDNIINIMATSACRAAIKAGNFLNENEIDNLLKDMENTQNISQCNHGRPTFFVLTHEDLLKIFKRV